MHHCYAVSNCNFCKFWSRVLGHPLMFLVGDKWKRIERKDIIGHMRNLKLELVGGLVKRGWTVHDIDIVGNQKHVATFARRLRKAGIKNPVHFCDRTKKKHSHLFALWNGLLLILNG